MFQVYSYFIKQKTITTSKATKKFNHGHNTFQNPKYLFVQISLLYMLTVVHVVRNYVLESTIDREVIEKYKFYNYVVEDATNSDREIYAWHVYSEMGFQNISTSDRMGTRIWKIKLLEAS